jgi:hypothetical protein
MATLRATLRLLLLHARAHSRADTKIAGISFNPAKTVTITIAIFEKGTARSG